MNPGAMTAHLLRLPAELQVHVYTSLPDLDDALYLSFTCSGMFHLYSSHRSNIDRQIIVSFLALPLFCQPTNTRAQTSSPVYEYDFCLSKFAKATDEFAAIFAIMELVISKYPRRKDFQDLSFWIASTRVGRTVL